MPDIISLILLELQRLIEEYIAILAYVLPRMLAATLVIVIGWILGRVLGKVVYFILRVGKIDEAISETPVGKRLKEAGYSLSRLLDLVTRIAVYLFSIGVAIKVIGFPEAIQTAQSLIILVGQLISGTAVLVVGVFIVEKTIELAEKIVGEETPFMKLALSAAHVTLLGMVFLAALSQMGVDLSPLASLFSAIAWGVGIGIGLTIVILCVATFREPLYELLKMLSTRERKPLEKGK
ncbi:MAG: hypothetical protein DRJ51_04110 [Thermoprotei archaeon]|nr:MAG: hypothetical protein DRJ51_04110 [Thermoprotei archaeon]RLF03330.1 MAG: hypothetical protein DRJ59_00950 [Thermoprotei archaeon]